MPKFKCREYLLSLRNFTKGDVPLTEIAKNLIVGGVSKQLDIKKVANSLSNRIYNDGYFSDDEIKILDKVYKSNDILIPQSKDQAITLDYFPDVFGSCGNGVFQFSTKKEQITLPKNILYKNFTPGKQYFVINAKGNSMQPLFYDKDKLVIESWDGEQIIDNSPYVFGYQDNIYIKRLAKNVDQLMIISDNKDYDIRKLEGKQLEDVNIIGMVVGLMRDLR